jgi:Fe-S cluster assembly ATP-binding protein
MGLFLAMQYPIEVPGVSLQDVMSESFAAAGRDDEPVRELVLAEAHRIGFDERFLTRPMNVDLSGGEKKRNETLQLGVLRPRFAVLDEIDSGLDVDALRAVSRRIEAATNEESLGVLAITHYNRLLHELKPDVIHVLSKGRIVATGGAELALELERTGYAAYGESEDQAEAPAKSLAQDPFADPLA